MRNGQVWVGVISLILVLNAAEVRGDDAYEEFLEGQWSKLAYPLAMPNPLFVPPASDLAWLKVETAPAARVELNRRVNSAHFGISRRLAACISPDRPAANWFTFATWASKSAGRMIDGTNFEPAEADPAPYRHMLESGRASRQEVAHDQAIDGLFLLAKLFNTGSGTANLAWVREFKRFQEDVFAETNYQIAAEMNPIAAEFLALFCASSPTGEAAVETFFAKFTPREALLKRAFRAYADAIAATEARDKLELNYLGSVLQVFHEQERVQENIRLSMHDRRVARIGLFPGPLTAITGFTYGADTGHLYFGALKFIHELRVVTLAPELAGPTNADVLELHRELGLPARIAGKKYRGSLCQDWSVLECRKRFLSQLFREFALGEPRLWDEP